MVLLCGIPGDKPFEMIADALDDLNTAYVVLNQQQFADMDINCTLHNNELTGELTIGDAIYPLQNFTGVYNRMMSWQALPNAQQLSPAQQKHCEGFHDLLFNWIEVATCRVMNTNSAMSSNTSKPYQALAIKQQGFIVPETIITNLPHEVQRFQQNKISVIYKSISGVRSIVHELNDDDAARLPLIQSCPTMFQEKLNGNNLRVHVVGNKCFAHFIHSNIVDYRYASKAGGSATIEAFELNEKITKACIALSKKLRLPLAGIDLFVTPANEYYCFEVNPSPGFSFFENTTGQPISAAIATYLCGE
jgi:RimK-like ATP-grasp domain